MFKNKSPYIKFVPSLEGLTETVPVLPAKDILPKWWKSVSFTQDVYNVNNKPASTGTTRRCPGIIDILKHGWVIQMWCDLYVKVLGTDRTEFKFSDERHNAHEHPRGQFLDIVPKHIQNKYYSVLKLASPWSVITSPGYSVMQADPFYHFNEYFDAAGGIQDTDIFHDASAFLLLKKDGEFIIERGTPLFVLYPFKREVVRGEVEEFNIDRYRKIMGRVDSIAHSKFSSLLSYRMQQHKQKKCPFHLFNK